MILIKQSELINYKCRDNIECKCEYCNEIFYIKKNLAMRHFKNSPNVGKFCSRKCADVRKRKRVNLTCKQCGDEYERNSCYNKTINTFCSKSCSATYNNTHKTKGYRRSKLELWLEEQLTKTYLNLEIHFNKTDTINSELDIYIPSLKLAFELNGIFHYEPIYSEEKLKRTQNNDQRKFQACLEKKIELCIIDVSKINYFKLKHSKYFLDIIIQLINKKLVGDVGLKPTEMD